LITSSVKGFAFNGSKTFNLMSGTHL